MMRKGATLGVMGALLVVLALPSETQAETMTPPEIWRGYDPRAEPLDEEVLRTWSEDGVEYKEVYFNGEKFDGKYVRIYGIYAAPAGGRNLPALLHIHGGGQTVNEAWLKEFAGRGYAVLTFNWGGKWPNRERFTLWNDVPNGNHKERTGHRVTLPSPRSDAFFLWTQAAMRAVTYLERQAEVDGDRIGAFGISMGGTIMWNMAFDPRIKAGCAIYGAGWNTYRHMDPKYIIGYSAPTPGENDLRWRRSMAPEASAPYVHFPMLFLSASNDHHGDMDRAEDSLKLIPEGVPRAWALTPRFRHHIGADFIHNLPVWMDVHLKGKRSWPAHPKTELRVGENRAPLFALKPDRHEEVEKVEVFYALENPYSVNRHWRDGQVRESDDTYLASTPVMNVDEYLFIFANVTYKSGIVISSPLQAVIPAELGAVATMGAPSRVFYEGSEGLDGWVCPSWGTDPIPVHAQKRLMTAVGPEGKPGFTVDRVNPLTYAPGDPGFRAPKGAALQFDIKTEQGEDFTVKLHRNYSIAGADTSSADVTLGGDRGWQTVTLTGSDFLNEKTGETLGESMNEVNALEFSMPRGRSWQDPHVIFRNFRWIGGEVVPHVHAYRSANVSSRGVAADSDDAAHLVDHETVKTDPLIQNVNFNSTNRYAVVPNGFKKGAKVHTDRNFVLTEVPNELNGGTLIQTPVADRAGRMDPLITFTVQKDCTVYVGMKENAWHPAWVSSWQKPDFVAQAGNRLVFYRRAFTAGQPVILGSGYGIPSMYIVVIKE